MTLECKIYGGVFDIAKKEKEIEEKQAITEQADFWADSKKAARRMMFSSFVLTIDTKTSELKSLRMNERGGYTEYRFSGYQFK